MSLLTAVLIGVLVTSSIYLLLQRNLFDVLLGVALLSHSVNVLLISISGWRPETKPPILEDSGIAADAALQSAVYVDPLPQALILTAIVIGFGTISFLIVLLARTYETNKSLAAGEMSGEDHYA